MVLRGGGAIELLCLGYINLLNYDLNFFIQHRRFNRPGENQECKDEKGYSCKASYPDNNWVKKL
jgi:hypothetical protein